MQEEVTQKTIALYVKVGKGAARLTEQALQKAIQKFLEQKSKPAHGKQTMRQLMKQNAGVSNIEITDSNIKAFESTAKKYNIDFSLKKVKGEQTRYLVFFKGRDADVMKACFISLQNRVPGFVAERCRWQMQRGEDGAAVKIWRNTAIFWAPQEGLRSNFKSVCIP